MIDAEFELGRLCGRVVLFVLVLFGGGDYGKGKIAAVYMDLGERYMKSAGTVTRDFMESLVGELFPDPVVEVDGTRFVDVTVMLKDGKLLVNLVNTAGPHADDSVYIYDTVPPVGPVRVAVNCPVRPTNVTIEPGNRKASYHYINGKVLLTLPSVELHDISASKSGSSSNSQERS